MSSLAVVLTGFDDVCCRSNSICNFLLIQTALDSKYKLIDIYVHPSEFTLIYKYFIRVANKKHMPSRKINVKKGWEMSNKYEEIYTVYSSVISTFSADQNYKLIDSSLPPDYIAKNLKI
tara:strand:- start:1614 stop:1970 length:357 start_codon:yes stop_codon:yes gene_type:complete